MSPPEENQRAKHKSIWVALAPLQGAPIRLPLAEVHVKVLCKGLYRFTFFFFPEEEGCGFHQLLKAVPDPSVPQRPSWNHYVVGPSQPPALPMNVMKEE